ncbi:FecR family protein [Pedobacter sp. MC2016-14]|uniref:FecR family protein n=1 Tax=Pedobacter sp. MC2016-14 TaxID=2897327 RepID=UPI001E3D9A88|nr:FecR family protein [Pedobacter sp. MC2016-14]MCD0489826.1 FecR family protein [Pedobacter sp. MC2016-14]
MTPNSKDYADYELYDFLMDLHFKKWISADEGSDIDKYWKRVMELYPGKKDMILQARQIAGLTKAGNEKPGLRKSIWENIEREINTGVAEETQLSVFEMKPKHRFKNIVRYAAAAVVACCVCIWLIERKSSPVLLNSGYGESKELLLPDGSIVQLGANSSISYEELLTEGKNREVWISGEAKFVVKHLNTNPKAIKATERFIVHMKDGVDVEVLGTVFTVNDRRAKATIDLESGAVKVTSPSGKNILLKPGESVELKISSSPVIKKEKHRPVVHQWQNNTLVLHGTTIKEIIAIMEDNYGIKIRIDANELLLKKLDGILPLDDEQKALMILGSITDSQMLKEGDVIVFSAK